MGIPMASPSWARRSACPRSRSGSITSVNRAAGRTSTPTTGSMAPASRARRGFSSPDSPLRHTALSDSASRLPMIMSMESVNGQTGAEPRTGDRRHRHFASVLRAIAGVLDLEAVLAEITAAVTAVRPDGVCLVRLVDREAGGYRLARAPGILADRPRIIPFGTGLSEVVARSRQPLLILDVRSDPRFVDVAWYAGRDLTVFYGVPLLDGDEVLGILNVSLPTGAQPTEEEREDIDLFAAQAALAIKNARLFGEAERRRREAEALAAVARGLAESLDEAEVGARIVNGVLALLGGSFSRLWRSLPDGSLKSVAWGGTLPPGGQEEDTF